MILKETMKKNCRIKWVYYLEKGKECDVQSQTLSIWPKHFFVHPIKPFFSLFRTLSPTTNCCNTILIITIYLKYKQYNIDFDDESLLETIWCRHMNIGNHCKMTLDRGSNAEGSSFTCYLSYAFWYNTTAITCYSPPVWARKILETNYIS